MLLLYRIYFYMVSRSVDKANRGSHRLDSFILLQIRYVLTQTTNAFHRTTPTRRTPYNKRKRATRYIRIVLRTLRLRKINNIMQGAVRSVWMSTLYNNARFLARERCDYSMLYLHIQLSDGCRCGDDALCTPNTDCRICRAHFCANWFWWGTARVDCTASTLHYLLC